MIVVSDSSPLNYLVLINAVQILPELFGEILIPDAVLRELQDPGTPPNVAAWIAQRPHWLRIQAAPVPLQGAGVEKLGAGEREAIAFALQFRPEGILLIDEGRGRREAASRQIRVIGVLGLLDMAAARGLIDLPETIERLRETTFYVTPVLLKKLLDADGERKKWAPFPRNR